MKRREKGSVGMRYSSNMVRGIKGRDVSDVEKKDKKCLRDDDVRRYAEGLRILHSHTRASQIAGYARRSSRSCCHCFP